MEKQGMGRGKRFFCFGLLILLFLLMPAGAEEGEIPEVRIETFPVNPTVNNPWSIFVLVRHPNPLEVNVKPPNFPPSLVLERVRADTRFIVDDERWTRVEFRFVSLREGELTLGPFEVETPVGKVSVSGIRVRFGVETVRQRYQPRFRWLTPLPAFYSGEKAVIFLELTNWDPNRQIPERFFLGRAPLNAIVEEGLPLAMGGGVFRYPISIIPLEENRVAVEAFTVNYDIYRLAIPGIVLSVLPARISQEEADLPDEITPEETAARVIPFPQTRENILFIFQGEYDRITARARALWNNDLKAETLAELRRNERDSFCGPFLVPIRQEIEHELGIGFTERERWRPLKIPLAVYAIFFAVFIFALVFLFVLRPRWVIQKRNLRFLRWNSFLSVVVIIFTIGLIMILLVGNLGDFPSGRSNRNTAVLKSTYSYRIPDFRGVVNDMFSDGQPVIVGDYNGDWRLAQTPDGRSGWVPRESVITY